jgi:hypothetical protein
MTGNNNTDIFQVIAEARVVPVLSDGGDMK